MRVELADGVDPQGWFTAGRLYTTVSIEISSGKQVRFRVLADDGTPILCSATDFLVVDEYLPGDWGVSSQGEVLKVAPLALLRPGFWVDYFDGDAAARGELAKVLEIVNGS